MERQNIYTLYKEKSEKLQAEIVSLKKRNKMFLVSELFSFVLAIGFVVIYTIESAIVYPVLAVLMAIVYVAVRRLDVQNGERIERQTDLKAVYDKEMAYLDGDYSQFGDGREYADPKHPFAYDMDVFGKQSLFHRINRTVTTGGSDYLARCLSCLDGGKDFADGRRQTIDQLAQMVELRTLFMAQGQRQRINTRQVLESINGVREMSMSPWPLSSLSMIVAVAAIVAFAAIVVLAFCGVVPAVVAFMWGTLQLFIVQLCCTKPLKAINKAVNNLHKQMRGYVELIRLIETYLTTTNFAEHSSKRRSLKETEIREISEIRSFKEKSIYEVRCPKEESIPVHAFDKLNKTLCALDRRGNLLGLIFTDMFLLSDYFLVRRFLKWRRDYIDKMEGWINEVSTIDALVSMATFAYNEPHACRAEVVESGSLVYEAKGLYHPFLGSKAVRNDFNIQHRNYYIVTGANMAGKSTFLRSVGINYILARNGMPVFADNLKVSVYNLFTSMRTSDDLSGGISYFNAELLRLRQLVSLVACPNTHPLEGTGEVLIILDEILKGTNSLDKLNGSRMFLEAISKKNVTGIIATHDLELSKMADEHDGRFHNYCFEIDLADDITYTYKITPGVARNQNATHLLRNIIKGL